MNVFQQNIQLKLCDKQINVLSLPIFLPKDNTLFAALLNYTYKPTWGTAVWTRLSFIGKPITWDLKMQTLVRQVWGNLRILISAQAMLSALVVEPPSEWPSSPKLSTWSMDSVYLVYRTAALALSGHWIGRLTQTSWTRMCISLSPWGESTALYSLRPAGPRHTESLLEIKQQAVCLMCRKGKSQHSSCESWKSVLKIN